MTLGKSGFWQFTNCNLRHIQTPNTPFSLIWTLKVRVLTYMGIAHCVIPRPEGKWSVRASVQNWSLQRLSNAILAVKKVLLFPGHFTKMCFVEFPPFTVKAYPKTACHKIQWLQFLNRNIVGLQSRHSSKHSQISMTPAISTMHWLQLRLGNCTTTCERGFSKHKWVKSARRSRLKLETLDALMRVSLCGLPMENMDWAKKNWHLKIDRKQEGFAFGVGWWLSALCRESR